MNSASLMVGDRVIYRRLARQITELNHDEGGGLVSVKFADLPVPVVVSQKVLKRPRDFEDLPLLADHFSVIG